MSPDPIVAEIRGIREEIAARFNYDIHAICEYARQRDAADVAASLQTFITNSLNVITS